MMKWLFSGLIVLSVLFGSVLGRMDAVTSAALSECGGAVQLTISLVGSMCLWSGLMRIAEKSGLTEMVSRLFSPLIRLLFEKIESGSAAAQAITMNLTANLLGLGNAATPLGIAAMKEMDKENRGSPAASNNMAMFVVLNTASLQLLPTTTALLRANNGCQTPMDILPAVWAASLASVSSGVIAAKLLSSLRPAGLPKPEAKRRLRA